MKKSKDAWTRLEKRVTGILMEKHEGGVCTVQECSVGVVGWGVLSKLLHRLLFTLTALLLATFITSTQSNCVTQLTTSDIFNLQISLVTAPPLSVGFGWMLDWDWMSWYLRYPFSTTTATRSEILSKKHDSKGHQSSMSRSQCNRQKELEFYHKPDPSHGGSRTMSKVTWLSYITTSTNQPWHLHRRIANKGWGPGELQSTVTL